MIKVVAVTVVCITVSIRIFIIKRIRIIIINMIRLRALLNLFNTDDQIVHIARQLIHKIALFSDECCKLALGHAIIEICRRSCHAWLENRKRQHQILSLSTKRNQVRVVVKVEYKITNGLPMSYKCSYQSQTEAKLNWQNNLLLNVSTVAR